MHYIVVLLFARSELINYSINCRQSLGGTQSAWKRCCFTTTTSSVSPEEALWWVGLVSRTPPFDFPIHIYMPLIKETTVQKYPPLSISISISFSSSTHHGNLKPLPAIIKVIKTIRPVHIDVDPTPHNYAAQPTDHWWGGEGSGSEKRREKGKSTELNGPRE